MLDVVVDRAASHISIAYIEKIEWRRVRVKDKQLEVIVSIIWNIDFAHISMNASAYRVLYSLSSSSSYFFGGGN